MELVSDSLELETSSPFVEYSVAAAHPTRIDLPRVSSGQLIFVTASSPPKNGGHVCTTLTIPSPAIFSKISSTSSSVDASFSNPSKDDDGDSIVAFLNGDVVASSPIDVFEPDVDVDRGRSDASSSKDGGAASASRSSTDGLSAEGSDDRKTRPIRVTSSSHSGSEPPAASSKPIKSAPVPAIIPLASPVLSVTISTIQSPSAVRCEFLPLAASLPTSASYSPSKDTDESFKNSSAVIVKKPSASPGHRRSKSDVSVPTNLVGVSVPASLVDASTGPVVAPPLNRPFSPAALVSVQATVAKMEVDDSVLLSTGSGRLGVAEDYDSSPSMTSMTSMSRTGTIISKYPVDDAATIAAAASTDTPSRSSSSNNHNAETPSRLMSLASFQPPQSKLKKSWYSALTPTYKTRSEEFLRLFKKGMQPDEKLIVDYSCALQKDILVHGRLYVSQNRICFHAKIMGWVTLLTIPCKDITAMTKEKTARVIPNAIQLNVTSDSGSSSSSNNVKHDRYFFTSFSARDKSYLMLFRVWQNALLDQPMSMQELWQWVHFCYGEELGLTAEDSDYVPTDSRPSGSGRQKISYNSSSVVSSFNDGCRSVASSLSFSESITDEEILKKRMSFNGGSGVSSKYSPPVDQAVDAMADANYSGVSTSEMEGPFSEDGGGQKAARLKTLSGSPSDEVTPERPPRHRKSRAGAGTMSNSDTDGGKRDTIKGMRVTSAGGGATTATKPTFVMSEPETRRGREIGEAGAAAAAKANVGGGNSTRSRRQSGAGSPKKKATAAAAGAPMVTSQPNDVRGDKKASAENNNNINNNKIETTSKSSRQNHRASPQHWARSRTETHNGHSAAATLLDDTSGDEADDLDEHDRPESFCPCTSHLPVLALNKIVNVSVDQMHNLIFTENQWNKEFIMSSKRTDYSATPWTLEGANSPQAHSNPTPAAVAMSGGNRKRILNYVVHLKPTIGPKTCNVTETQSEHGYSVPGDIYVLDCEVKNSGIPYGDNFYILNRYCLTRVAKRQTRIRVTSEVRYTKSVWGLVKNMIEKNAIQGIEEHYTDLGEQLMKEGNRLAGLREASKGAEKALSNTQDNKSNPVAKRRTRRMKPRSSRDSIGDGGGSGGVDPNVEHHDVATPPVVDAASMPTIGHHSKARPHVNSSVGNSSFPSSHPHQYQHHEQREAVGNGLWTCFKVLVVTFAFLLFFNALLYLRVKELENRQMNFGSYDAEADVKFMTEKLNGKNKPEDWLKILKKQQMLHDLEVEKWHRVLDSTMEVMGHMQESLRILHESVGGQRRRREATVHGGDDALDKGGVLETDTSTASTATTTATTKNF